MTRNKYIHVATTKLQQLLSQTSLNVWRDNCAESLSDFAQFRSEPVKINCWKARGKRGEHVWSNMHMPADRIRYGQTLMLLNHCLTV